MYDGKLGVFLLEFMVATKYFGNKGWIYVFVIGACVYDSSMFVTPPILFYTDIMSI